ncbi:MAG: radical SAM family heme chaperone HemW [Oscillospiraceae bacterium]|jgi:oxygen-independent coproporphyrinogen-3 oxidase|nr:radical SAM family heme chaperone HemW [Oscillospiraceae bacterium]
MPNLGVYIHIPFCGSKCAYCDFYSLPNQPESLMKDYVKALARHIEEAGRFLGKGSKGGIAVDTVFFGGGTPAALGAKRLGAVMKTVKKNFNLATSCEITAEANPGSVDARSLKKLRRAGFNRISFGVQAMQQELLTALGRSHTPEQAADSVREAADAGFTNISVDVMYGIPGQTRAQLTETLRSVCTWRITHLSLYGLKLEEGTPLAEAEPVLPKDEEQAEMYLEAVELLSKEGLKQYEISNFSRQGYICRHNYKYWTLEPYVGFGAAAHSDFGGKRYSFVKDIQAYINGVRDSESLMEEMQQVPMIERAGEYVMLGLRTANGVSSNEYTRLFKASFDTLEDKLERCAKWGLAETEGDRWRLTPKGFLVSNQIIGELLNTDAPAPSAQK